jgi:hypothetical protein
VFAIIEHNPWNPATRVIVSRCPVDENAILLSHGETSKLLAGAGLIPHERQYFLYLPEKLYKAFGSAESLFSWLPLGGQYAVFGKRAR